MLKNGDPTRDLQQSRSKNTYLNGNEEENDGGWKIRSSSSICLFDFSISIFLYCNTPNSLLKFFKK